MWGPGDILPIPEVDEPCYSPATDRVSSEVLAMIQSIQNNMNEQMSTMSANR